MIFLYKKNVYMTFENSCSNEEHDNNNNDAKKQSLSRRKYTKLVY